MKFNVAEEFTPWIGGRYRKDGDASGEELRDDKLIPILQKNPDEKLAVDFNGSHICWSTLEEVFGGLVRKMGPSIVDRVDVIAKDDSDIPEDANQYMKEAAEHYGEDGWK